MASRPQKVDLDFEGNAKVTGLPTPTNPSDAVNKAYADGLGGGSAVIYEVEVDFGSTSVSSKTFNVVNASVTSGMKIIINQSGNAPTGRTADENEWSVLSARAFAKAGSFDMYVDCLNGKVSGKFKFNYMLGA